ncbi:hypothetical protein ES703_66023 [subsurface metagenome]
MEKSLRALKLCAAWLAACLEIGWSKSDLDDLENLFWKYHHPRTGEKMICDTCQLNEICPVVDEDKPVTKDDNCIFFEKEKP